MEGEVGRFRRRHLVPVRLVASLDELNDLIAACDRADDSRRIGRRAETIGEAFAVEAGYLRPLPAEPFECHAELSAKVDTKARVRVRQSWCSVPARLARRRVTVRLHAAPLDVVGNGKVVASHARSLHKGTEHLVLDHYLEVLVRKPGALAGSVALAQARNSGAFTDAHQRPWAEARRRLGDGAGTRAVNPTTVTIDAADAVELAEICELLAGWLAADPAAAAGYDRHIGQPDQAAELRADLGRLAGCSPGRRRGEPGRPDRTRRGRGDRRGNP